MTAPILHISHTHEKYSPFPYFTRIVHPSSQHRHCTQCSGRILFSDHSGGGTGFPGLAAFVLMSPERDLSSLPKAPRTGNTASVTIAPKQNKFPSRIRLPLSSPLPPRIRFMFEEELLKILYRDLICFKCILILQEWPKRFWQIVFRQWLL